MHSQKTAQRLQRCGVRMAESVANAARNGGVVRAHCAHEVGRRRSRAAVMADLEKIGAQLPAMLAQELLFFRRLRVADQRAALLPKDTRSTNELSFALAKGTASGQGASTSTIAPPKDRAPQSDAGRRMATPRARRRASRLAYAGPAPSRSPWPVSQNSPTRAAWSARLSPP